MIRKIPLIALATASCCLFGCTAEVLEQAPPVENNTEHLQEAVTEEDSATKKTLEEEKPVPLKIDYPNGIFHDRDASLDKVIPAGEFSLDKVLSFCDEQKANRNIAYIGGTGKELSEGLSKYQQGTTEEVRSSKNSYKLWATTISEDAVDPDKVYTGIIAELGTNLRYEVSSYEDKTGMEYEVHLCNSPDNSYYIYTLVAKGEAVPDSVITINRKENKIIAVKYTRDTNKEFIDSINNNGVNLYDIWS